MGCFIPTIQKDNPHINIHQFPLFDHIETSDTQSSHNLNFIKKDKKPKNNLKRKFKKFKNKTILGRQDLINYYIFLLVLNVLHSFTICIYYRKIFHLNFHNIPLNNFTRISLQQFHLIAASRIRYEITRGNFGGAFAVKNMTGAIYVAGPLDYETRRRVSDF